MRTLWMRGLNLAMGAAVLAALALTAACGSVNRPQHAEGGKAQGQVAQGQMQADFAALDRDRNVSTLAKSPGRRLPDAVVSSRLDATERSEVMKLVSLDDDPGSLPGPLRPRAAPRQSAPSGREITQLVPFASAPFPFDGTVPGRGPFLDAGAGGRRGHRTWRGGVLWEDTTFGDDRVLVHIPAGFDPNRPAAMVVFFHGHGATLERDVRDRQKIAEQVSASGANAVLVAPQFARDARDSSAGKFWEPGGFRSFLDEAGHRLAALHGDPASTRAFGKMPVVLVSYSGGYVPAAWSLADMGASPRMRGVVMLDSLYGEEEKFASWIATARSAFFVSAYTRYTARRNTGLASTLASRGVASGTEMPDSLSRGGVVFLATGPEADHQDYCTRAWTENPIRDVLTRLPELSVRDPDTVASITPRGRRRSAVAEPR